MKTRFISSAWFICLSFVVSVQAQNLDPSPIKISIDSSSLEMTRELQVLLPDSYEANSTAKYPVIYVLDAKENLYHTWATGRFLSHYDNMPEVIVVGLFQQNRLIDLTPDKTDGPLNQFSTFLENEVIPLITKRFRTENFRMIAGHSLGGLFVLNILAEKPDLFNAYFAYSPSTWWADKQVVGAVTHALSATKDISYYLYMNMGAESERMQSGFDQLQTVFNGTQSKHLRFKIEYMSSEAHTTTPAVGQFNAYRDLYARWKMPNEYYTKSFEAIEEYYAVLSEELGYTIDVPEKVINNKAHYWLRNGDNDQKAIALFEKNIKRFPQSHYALANLAIAYEQLEQFNVAKTCMAKALALLDEQHPNYTEFKSVENRIAKRLATE